MEDDDEQEEEKNSARFWDPTEPPPATARRLELARQLLENGDIEKALSVARSGLDRATSQGVIFLVLFRKVNPALADQHFASLLEQAAGDPRADATCVSLLSSYVLAPSVLVSVTQNGLLMNPWTQELPPADLTPALRATFFSVAVQILLRPSPLAELGRTSAGRAGTYFTIARLLPTFERHDPEVATALRARLNVLGEGAQEPIPEPHRAFMNA